MADQHLHPPHWARIGLLALLLFLITTPLLYNWRIHTVTGHDFLFEQDDTPPIWPLPENETEARKAQLVNLLLPAIQENNRKLLEKRARLEALHRQIEQGKHISGRDRAWLEDLSQRYKLDVPETLNSQWSRILLRRIDIVPADLALAQAALESAWGTSRFAVEGNNYFGHWCFVKGCGLVPLNRPAGALHEVARFSSPAESVRRYMHNLNSHPRYTELRLIREAARQNNRSFTGSDLAAGLEGYSELGTEYIDMVRSLIRHNQFDRFASY